MQYAILLQLKPNGMYQATVPLIPKLKKVATTRAQVLQAIQKAIIEFEKVNEVVYFQVPETANGSILQLGVNPVDDLTALAGTWSQAEAAEFEQATADFAKIDEGLWQ